MEDAPGKSLHTRPGIYNRPGIYTRQPVYTLGLTLRPRCVYIYFFFFFLIVCFTSYFMFCIEVLPHCPGVVNYHLLLRQETRIPGVAPFSFRIGIWDLFCA